MDKKETIEFTVMKQEIKTITKQMDIITPKIERIHDTFIKGDGKITVLNKEVFGNGKPGIRSELNELRLTVEKKFAYYAGCIGIASIIFTIIVQLAIKKFGG